MQQRTVYVYVLDTLADWEVGHAIAQLNARPFGRGESPFVVSTVAENEAPVTTMGGMRIVPDATLADLDAASTAMLILPGGATWDSGGNEAALQAARAVLDAGGFVAAICGATAGLARAGLLDRRAHTSSAVEYLAATGYGGAAHYLEERVVTDDRVITAGSTAPIEFAAAIFEALGLYPAKVIAAWAELNRTGDARHYHALMQAAAE